MTRYYHCVVSTEEPLSEKAFAELNNKFRDWSKARSLAPVVVLQTDERPPVMRFNKKLVCEALLKRKHLFD